MIAEKVAGLFKSVARVFFKKLCFASNSVEQVFKPGCITETIIRFDQHHPFSGNPQHLIKGWYGPGKNGERTPCNRRNQAHDLKKIRLWHSPCESHQCGRSFFPLSRVHPIYRWPTPLSLFVEYNGHRCSIEQPIHSRVIPCTQGVLKQARFCMLFILTASGMFAIMLFVPLIA